IWTPCSAGGSARFRNQHTELRSAPPNGHLAVLGAWRYAQAIVGGFVAAGWVDAADVDVRNRPMP
ncbi:MAG: hypothetical protein P8Q20_10405, partial [Acidimicrobiales bacterium]|nr:hypothetical protein [Acidimicrobiales bacterium]